MPARPGSRSIDDAAASRRRRRTLVAGGLAAVAIGAAIALAVSGDDGGGEGEPAGGEAEPGWRADEFYGVSAPLLRDYTQPGGEALLDAFAGGIAAAGPRWARFSLDPSVEQPAPGRIEWAVPDAVVAALARHGVRAAAVFLGTPGWAADPAAVPTCGVRAAPVDVAAWAEFVAAAVARYGRGGEFWREHAEIEPRPIEAWEIGNEQNTSLFWCPAAEPEAYAELYAASREAALAEDPDALVMVGGLAPLFEGGPAADVPVGDFLRRMLAAAPRLRARIPAVAIHPYGSDPEQVLRLIGRFREEMRAVGLGETPVVANEIGWYTSGPEAPQLASAGQRARWISELTRVSPKLGCGLVAFGVHAWMTAEADRANGEHWYGLADPASGAPNESGSAYAAAIAAVGDSGSPSGSPRPCS